MPIIYHEKSKTFHLFNEDVSYVMKVSAGPSRPASLWAALARPGEL